MKELTYYTDGGCYPNPGKGTWAFVLADPPFERTGHDPETTNNRMELTAIVEAINHGLSFANSKVIIYSDSLYCVNAFSTWMHKWAKKQWKNVKNDDIFRKLYKIKKDNPFRIELHWVRGHNGHLFNEQADLLCRQEYADVFGGIMEH